MQIDLEHPGDTDLYSLATHIVVPRPIAWVTTVDASAVVNLAPFSYFGLICDDPIIMVLSIGRRKGVHKDTARNLLATGEAVIHIVEEALLEAMITSSKELPAGQSEIALTKLQTAASVKVAPPRLDSASLALECRVDRHLEVGNDVNDLFLLRAIHAHVKDAALLNGVPDPKLLRVVGKMGASDYAITDVVRTLKRG